MKLLRVMAAWFRVAGWRVRLAAFPCSPHDYGDGNASSFCLRCGEYKPKRGIRE